jgi:predicted ATPase
MSALQQRVREAASGHGALCVIDGEPGMGKTRCVHELAAHAHALGVQTLLGRCLQEPAAPPLWPIVAALRGLETSQPELAARARASTFGFSEGEGGVRDLASVGRRHARFGLIERLARLLREVATTCPTLLILDDLHWADAFSLDLLAFIAPELREIPLCIVATLRHGERQRGAGCDQSLRRLLRYAQSIRLGAFGAAEVAELAFVISDQRPSDRLAEALRRAAGGIPLFVEEIVRSLVADHGEGALERLRSDAVKVPWLVRELLRERIQRLPEMTVRLLGGASVIGDSFDLSLLMALVELQPALLLARLEPALVAGQLEREAPHVYRFAHSLLRWVLYDEMPAAERVALDRRLRTLLLVRDDDAGSRADDRVTNREHG